MSESSSSIPQKLQELPPQWAHFCLHCEQFIRNELCFDLRKKQIVVAFSGGSDSTALLLVLHYLSKKNNGKVIAAHLDHQLRIESSSDAAWAKAFANSLNIPIVIESINVSKFAQEKNIGIEEAGRIVRYSFLKNVKEHNNCDIIAVGHHVNDLCEDVLMRLIRGTGWPGLAGMMGYDQERHLLRPFLLLEKENLTQFLLGLGAEWKEDLSNKENTWTRNRIRNVILPLLIKENPKFHESIARLWKVGKVDSHYWENEVNCLTNLIPNELLQASHKAKRLRLFKSCLKKIGTEQALAENLFTLDQAWENKRVGSTIQFPGNKIAKITSTGIVFSRND